MKCFLYKIIGKVPACQSLSNKHTIIMRERAKRISHKNARIILPMCLKRGLPCQK